MNDVEPATLPIPRPLWVKIEVARWSVNPGRGVNARGCVMTTKAVYKLGRLLFMPPCLCLVCNKKIHHGEKVYRPHADFVAGGHSRARAHRKWGKRTSTKPRIHATCLDKIHFECIGDERVMCPA